MNKRITILPTEVDALLDRSVGPEDYHRDDKMRDAINDGFDDATDGNTAEIQTEIDAFMALFSDEIKEGDQFTLATDKALGVTAYKNGEAQATIEGETFRLALLKIWLGDSPAQGSLKKAMLGI